MDLYNREDISFYISCAQIKIVFFFSLTKNIKIAYILFEVKKKFTTPLQAISQIFMSTDQCNIPLEHTNYQQRAHIQ